MKRTLRILALLSVVLAACTPTAIPPAATVAPTAATVTAVATATAAAIGTTATPRPLPASTAASTPAPAGVPAGDPGVGAATWAAHRCPECHGPQAGGGDGPKLAGRRLTYDRILGQVREGSTFMPGFTAEQVSDQDVANILAWLGTLN